MKIEFTKDWCVRMARMELEAGSEMEVGITPDVAPAVARGPNAPQAVPVEANVAFGRFVSLMRRSRRQTLERLAEEAEVEMTELFEIEKDSHHKPEPRTVFQLANYFSIPINRMMQLAGLSAPRDAGLQSASIRFAARSEIVEELNDIEKAALDAFVSVLSEKQ